MGEAGEGARAEQAAGILTEIGVTGDENRRAERQLILADSFKVASAAHAALPAAMPTGDRNAKTFCHACGTLAEFRFAPVLWPELIDEWKLTEGWANWFDLREGTTCGNCGANLRSCHHALGIVRAIERLTGGTARSLASAIVDPKAASLRIAEVNSAGALHQFLTRCKPLAYSEYGGRDPTVPSEDLAALSYPSEAFDLVVTSETLEHVPDVDAALREIHRVLRPGGLHVFTVPIVWDRVTRQRARMEAGRLVHLLPPSYHGRVGESQADYLVFHEFGSDFVSRCSDAGFHVTVARDETNPAIATLAAEKALY
jgi:SAM-dependent methyltransferase